jgi:hypothetical protein
MFSFNVERWYEGRSYFYIYILDWRQIIWATHLKVCNKIYFITTNVALSYYCVNVEAMKCSEILYTWITM